MNALTSGDPGAAVASIGEYGLQRLNIIIAAYEAFLDKVRGTDDVSFHLVLELLAAGRAGAPGAGGLPAEPPPAGLAPDHDQPAAGGEGPAQM